MRLTKCDFVDVILPLPLERNYTYAITAAEAKFIKQGFRVTVPFGKRNIYTALVYKLHQSPPTAYEAKSIHSILDKSPILNSFQFQLWEWISSYYMCTMGEVLRASLPSIFLLESETSISLNKSVDLELSSFSDDEYLIYEALQQQSSIKINEISTILNKKNTFPILQGLIGKKSIVLEQEVFEKYKHKLIRCVKIHSDYSSENSLQGLLDNLKRSAKQRELVVNYFSLSNVNPQVKVSELKAKSNASSSQVKALINKGIFEDYLFQIDRVKFNDFELSISKSLNKYQESALKKINSSFKTFDISLLHGVTSSGKTEIYVKKIESIIAQGKQVLYLVPEIALTSQLVHRLEQYFGNQIAVYHYRYSKNERLEVWNHVLNNSNSARVIIGARSSVLLPFR